MRPSFGGLAAVSTCLALAILAGNSAAQNAAPAPAHEDPTPPTPPVAAAPPRPAYLPVRATDAAAVERGRALFVTQHACASCHAADIRGTDSGNSLLRSIAVMQDANGELIGRAVPSLMGSFVADYVVLGGGNSKEIKALPPGTRLGHNLTAFRGGFRLWHLDDVPTLGEEGDAPPNHTETPTEWRMI